MPATADLPWQELHGNLRAFIARRVRNHADVDDLVQRVLLRVVTHLDTLRHAERLHAWVYRTARHVIIDHYRATSSRPEVATGDALDLDVTDGRSPAVFDDEEGAALRELAMCLAPLLGQLPSAQQEAIRLIDLEGTTQQDAARRAGVSLSGMKSRVQRGRQQLRNVLDACCRIDLDQRRSVTGFTARDPGACGCASCADR